MRRISIIACAFFVVTSLAGCTLLKVSLVPEVAPLQETALAGEGKDKILLLDISGIITSEKESSNLSGAKEVGLIPDIREALDRAAADKNVKAIVFKINSPGGGVTASDVLYHEIKRYKRDTGVKVVAHIMDMGTSGAYYVSLAADRITAQPTAVTGSIGVIMWHVDASGLLQKIGIRPVEIASGELKGMGYPYRSLTPEEKKIFQNVIDTIYGRFVNIIVQERKIPLEKVKALADGRIFTSEEAKAGGLIDETGYLEDAVNIAKKEAGLAQARVVTYSRPGEYRENIYSRSLININLGSMMEPGMRFMYLWWP